MRATSLGNALRDSQMSILATLDACSEAIEEHNELDAEYRVAVKVSAETFRRSRSRSSSTA
jgi:hypothetical protein